MIVVHDMPSECALQMHEVSLKYLLQFSSYRIQLQTRIGYSNIKSTSLKISD